ncbi:MAG: hypothetical protein IKU43_11255 [Clostridia bacterium]|nr:hypothetical protein [Clostridia bacterium]
MNFNGMIVFILGLVSGLPTGAVLALKMYERNAVSLSQARRIAIYSSVVSPAFCIIYFGNSVMKNTLCGVAVYISVVVTSIGVMLTEYCLFGKNEADDTHFDFQNDIEPRNESFTDVIVNSFMGLLNICAFVMFFMCIGEISSLIIGFIRGSSRTADALICGILEFSGGISKLSALKFGERFVYGAFLLGFGSVSAIMQVMDFCTPLGIRVRRLLIVRLVSALCVPVVSVGVIYIIRSVSDFFKESMLSCFSITLIITAFVFAFMIFIVEKSRKNIRKANIISKI